MNATVIDGLSLEGKPFNLPMSILWVDKQGNDDGITSGLRISNIRIENIGDEFIKSNRAFIYSIVDNFKLPLDHFYANIKGVSFDSTKIDIPGFTILQSDDYSYNFVSRFDAYDYIRKVGYYGNGYFYRLKNTINTSYYFLTSDFELGKRTNDQAVQIGVLFKLENNGVVEFSADVKGAQPYIIKVLDKDTLSSVAIDTTKFKTFGLSVYNKNTTSTPIGFTHSSGTSGYYIKSSWIYNGTGAAVILAFVVVRPTTIADIKGMTFPVEVRGYNVSEYTTNDYYNVEGAKTDMPKDLQPFDAGFRFKEDNSDIVYTWDGLNWVIEDGWSSNVHSGATSARPSLGFGEDGYKFHDTTLDKNIYSKVIQEPVLGDYVAARVDASTPGTKTISNTLTEGQAYWVGYSAKHSYGGGVVFRKTADSSTGQIVVLPNFNSNDKGAYFVAPSPTVYPYIFMYNYYTGSEFITFYKPFTTWLDEDGFVAGARQGNTASRPQLNFGDGGYRYYDTDINRNIYSKVDKGSALITETVAARSNSTVSNTLAEGKKYWLGFSAKNSWGGSVRFRKAADSSEGEIWLITNLNISDLGTYFIAPSPTDYPYIYMVNGWSGSETFTFQPAETSWIEDDGAAAGVLRSGATADRPASADIYTGFQYFDTTLGKFICWNGTAWVNLDGTALS